MFKNLVLCAVGALLLGGTPSAFAGEGKIVIDGSTTVGPIAKAFAEYYMGLHADVNITVSESGSGNGAKSLINGACDVADMSRAMQDKEVKAAEEKNVQPVAHIVAWDGIAIAVHPSNPVKALTVDQVRDIYKGEITNWNQVGGPDGAIARISRDTNSGTYECFEEKVMRGSRIAAGVEYVGSNGAIRARVQNTPLAIGYIGIGFVDRTVKALVINGVELSKETVLSRKYPVARPLFMYTNGEPKEGTPLAAFINLYKTPKGRELVEDVGFVAMPEAAK